MFWVYILYSEKFDKYYVGQSNDVDRRLLEHNEAEKNSYTSKFRPWHLIFAIEVSEDRGKAMLLEKFIKAQKSKAFILRLISERKLQENLLRRFE